MLCVSIVSITSNNNILPLNIYLSTNIYLFIYNIYLFIYKYEYHTASVQGETNSTHPPCYGQVLVVYR